MTLLDYIHYAKGVNIGLKFIFSFEFCIVPIKKVLHWKNGVSDMAYLTTTGSGTTSPHPKRRYNSK